MPTFPDSPASTSSTRRLREERFALIEETLKNYSIDGFELQLNYTPYYFHPDEVEAEMRDYDCVGSAGL